MLTEARRLQLDLRKAVKAEDYEKAAAIRDQIKTLERALEQGRAEGQSKTAASEVRSEPQSDGAGQSCGEPGEA